MLYVGATVELALDELEPEADAAVDPDTEGVAVCRGAKEVVEADTPSAPEIGVAWCTTCVGRPTGEDEGAAEEDAALVVEAMGKAEDEDAGLELGPALGVAEGRRADGANATPWKNWPSGACARMDSCAALVAYLSTANREDA